jgi:hypothetical protein
MSRYITCLHPQGTPEWHQDRLGKVTGSGCAAVFAKLKTGEAATRANLRMDKVLERILQRPTAPGFAETEAIAWGKENEQYARMAYEVAREVDVSESGFIYLPGINAGCSVDGFMQVGARKGISEIKCPKSKNHYAYLLAGVAPSEYLPQITHNLWITGADFCDFMSFDPRMPLELQQFYIRIERDPVAIQAHEAGVLQFLLEVDADERKMRALIESRRLIAAASQREPEFA